MKIGDKVFVEGVVHSLSENSSDIEVETCLGDVDYYPADKVRSDDKQIVVPAFVKTYLDRVFSSGMTGIEIVGDYWNCIAPVEVGAWINVHGTAFMHALVCGYKSEVIKKCYVKVPKTDRSFYWKVEGNKGVKLATSGNVDSFPDEKQFTMDEIKKYGLESCERVEVQDD